MNPWPSRLQVPTRDDIRELQSRRDSAWIAWRGAAALAGAHCADYRAANQAIETAFRRLKEHGLPMVCDPEPSK